MADSALASIFGVFNKLQERISSTVPVSPTFAAPKLKKLNDMVYEVHSPPPDEKPELELIFFHGLQVKHSDDAYVTTWMTRDNSQLWPQTYLAELFPKARIFTISYDSSAARTRQFGRLDMYCTAENLMSSLTDADVRVGRAGCPVVLVGHCLGGLVLKELCLSAAWKVGRKGAENFGVPRVYDLVSNLKGMFFYSTPHTGSFLGDELHKHFKGELLAEIETMKASSARRNQEFNDLKSYHGWATSGIGEALETYVEYLRKHILVVPEAATRPYVDTHYSAHADHYNVCKPEGKNSSSFKRLKEFLNELMEEYAKTKETKLQSWTPGRTSEFGDELPVGASLSAGESLVSSSGEYFFTNQKDGNLSVYNAAGVKQSLWETRWGGRGDVMLLKDGNLVLLDTEGTVKPVWASMKQTTAPGPYSLVMQDNGNLVIYGADHKPKWSSWEDRSSGVFTNVAGNAEMPNSVATWLALSDTLVSTNGMFKLVNQADGNLCIYNQDGKVTWSSGTRGKGVGHLYLQRTGNLVLYNTDGEVARPGAPIWSSNRVWTPGPYRLVMQDDGNLVIYGPHHNLTWASNAGSLLTSPSRSELPADVTLQSGDGLVSEAEEYLFFNQGDGNLVTYTNLGQATWASNTCAAGLSHGDLVLLTDGNLVLYDTQGSGKPFWASMSQGLSKSAGPYRLVMQDDGNLMIYGNSAATWAIHGLDGTSGRFTNSAGGHEMHSGVITWLEPCDMLVSRNRMFKFTNQADGNLCVYNSNGRVEWASGTRGKGSGNLYMQRDGSLVLYNTDGDAASPGAVIWASNNTGRRGNAPYKLVMEDDGNLVIYDTNQNPIWTSQAGAVWRLFTRAELPANGILPSGEALVSASEEFAFINQIDGNLVTYPKNGHPTWASNTWGEGRTKGDLKLLTDGNLVLFDSEGKPVWASMSQGVTRSAGPYRLVMQNDGNLVIHGNSGPTWAIHALDGTSGRFTSSEGRAEMPSGVTWLRPFDRLVSRNRMFRFVNQADGDLCIYKRTGGVEWASGTRGKGSGNLYMHHDGNLVLYNTDGNVASPGAVIWASTNTGRRGNSPYNLVMQDDGNLEIYDTNQTLIWTSKDGAVWRLFMRSELPANRTLPPGEALVSASEEFTFINQTDGNLVTYPKTGHPTWASNTWGEGRTKGDLKLLTDGNLVLFDSEGKPVWASMSQGVTRSAGPYRLVMQNDGNLMIHGNSGPTWAIHALDGTSGRFTSSEGRAEMPSGVTWLGPCDTLVSRNGMFRFVNQTDGDLCIYKQNGGVEWASGTQGKGSGNVYMQRDGNLVLYNTYGDVSSPGAPMWASKMCGRGTGPYKLIMQDDGNLVIHDVDHIPIWATNTAC